MSDEAIYSTALGDGLCPLGEKTYPLGDCGPVHDYHYSRVWEPTF